jgi:hypothetical protein
VWGIHKMNAPGWNLHKDVTLRLGLINYPSQSTGLSRNAIDVYSR